MLKFANDIISGLLSGFVIVVIATAFTALIFKDNLTPYFSIGITCALIGALLINTLISRFSSFKFGIVNTSPSYGAILAIIFANIANSQLPSEILLPTLLTTVALITLLIGTSMFFLGFFHLGQVARFLPFPVLGGIITGTSWIMVAASFSMLLPKQIPFENLFSNNTVLLQLFVGIGFALILILILRKNPRVWVLPLSIVVSSILIMLLLGINQFSHTDAISKGWLFNPFHPSFIYPSINSTFFQKIDWYVILDQLDFIASLIAVTIINLILNISGLEPIVRGKADLDHELKLTGLSNVASGLLFGMPATLSMASTVINKNAGAEHRMSGTVASLVCLLALFVAPQLISYIPKPIIAGLLLYTGLMIMIEWLYDGFKKLPYIDYLIVLTILITVAFLGFLPGVVIGIIITCIVFIIRYARIDAIKFATTGVNYHSNVIRPFYQQKWQAEKGDSIQIIKLQGYLFFGSAKILLDRVTRLIEQDYKKELRFLIFDFQHVNGVDSSATYQFIQLQQLIENTPIQIVFTNCSSRIIPQFQQQGVVDITGKIKLFPDLDQGMEWCEDELFKMMPENLKQKYNALSSTLSQLIPDEDDENIFMSYLQKKSVPVNHFLFKQDDIVNSLYFIESGEVAVFIQSQKSVVRVSKSGPGTIVGEIGFYLNTTRTASVRAETDCIIYELTKAKLTELENEHPKIALIFHRSLVNVLALRIIQTNYELLVVSQ